MSDTSAFPAERSVDWWSGSCAIDTGIGGAERAEEENVEDEAKAEGFDVKILKKIIKLRSRMRSGGTSARPCLICISRNGVRSTRRRRPLDSNGRCGETEKDKTPSREVSLEGLLAEGQAPFIFDKNQLVIPNQIPTQTPTRGSPLSPQPPFPPRLPASYFTTTSRDTIIHRLISDYSSLFP